MANSCAPITINPHPKIDQESTKSKLVASSLININEATSAELQQLKGIGPKRALHIEQFRARISPIRNTLDLCAATGISMKTAEQIADDIEWRCHDPMAINSGPAVVTTLVCVSLIYIGFDQITREPFVGPASFYHFSLALILLGGLAAAGDVVVAGVRKIPSESTWIFPLSILMLFSGLLIIAGMGISALILPYPDGLVTTLASSLTLLAFASVMVWLLYGPALTARFCLNDADKLDRWSTIYDFVLPILLFCDAILLSFHNGPTWMEEIFTGWCMVICAIGASELRRGNSAFFQTLSLADQSRVRFALRRLTTKFPQNRTLNSNDPQKRLIANLIAAGNVLVIAAILTGVLAT
ncbi:MAG: competence ComEA-like helix-hairpin-helix protein [Candidatus Azotimanducaceae bacterium]|jgi:competence ComEA-like helix-hairpin-helix protein